jgi:hypothetical protein
MRNTATAKRPGVRVVRDFAAAAPSGTPWRSALALWPTPWRLRWGLLANTLEDTGVGWREAERRAFDLVQAEKEQADGE